MSSSIITVCTRIHIIVHRQTNTYMLAQVTSLTDLPEYASYPRRKRGTKADTERKELTFRQKEGDNGRQDTRKKK